MKTNRSALRLDILFGQLINAINGRPEEAGIIGTGLTPMVSVDHNRKATASVRPRSFFVNLIMYVAWNRTTH